MSGAGVHPGGSYTLRVDDDFRQLSFAESQVGLRLPPSARNMDLTRDGERVTRLAVLNVSVSELRAALAVFGAEASDEPGWFWVRVLGLSPGFEVALVTTAMNLMTMN